MNTTLNLAQALETAQRAAFAASKVITKYRNDNSFAVNFKSTASDFVTTADIEAEKAILDVIQGTYPNHAFLTEEHFPTLDNLGSITKPLWVIDPIDGTTNFVYGLAQVGISIALYYDGAVQVAIVKNPFTDEEFTAIRGKGAFLNGTPIAPRPTDQLRHALVATGFPYARDYVPEVMKFASSVIAHCRDLRRFGAASLDICFVACGRIDAYYETVKPWDMAAGTLIAREAGAIFGNLFDKNPAVGIPADLHATDMLVATPKVYSELKAMLEQA